MAQQYNNKRDKYTNRDNSNQQANKTVKHTGCKYHAQTKNGEPCLTAWNYSRRNGMRKFICAPTKGTSDHESKTGKVWQNWMIKMTLSDGTTHLMSGLFDTSSRKLSCSQLGMTFNPNAPNGGYCGQFGK